VSKSVIQWKQNLHIHVSVLNPFSSTISLPEQSHLANKYLDQKP